MMDSVEASAFGGFALEAMDALKERFGPEVKVRNAMFIVEVDNGSETAVWMYATDPRGYVQKAFLNEAIDAIDQQRVNDQS